MVGPPCKTYLLGLQQKIQLKIRMLPKLGILLATYIGAMSRKTSAPRIEVRCYRQIVGGTHLGTWVTCWKIYCSQGQNEKFPFLPPKTKKLKNVGPLSACWAFTTSSLYVLIMFPMSSQYVPQVLNVLPKTSPKAPHLCPYVLAKCCPPFTYLGGSKGRNSILQNRTFYFGEPA
jgi:hypothetical protein